MSIIGRDLFARGAMKAADKARPSHEQLSRVEDAAPSEQWATSHGQATGPNATPHPQLATSGGTGLTHDPKTGSTVLHTSDGKTTTPGGLFQDIKGTARDAKEGARNEANDVARTAENNGETDGEKADVGKRTLKEKLMGGYNSLKDRVPDEHKDRAHEQVDRSKQFLRDEFPEERRDQFIYRLKKVSTPSMSGAHESDTCLFLKGHCRVPKAPRLYYRPHLVYFHHRDLLRSWQAGRAY